MLFAVFLLSLMTFLLKLKSGPLRLALAGAVAFGVALVVDSRRRPPPFIDVGMLARNAWSYRQRASDHGLHNLAMVTGALGAIVFISLCPTARSRVRCRSPPPQMVRPCPVDEANKHAADQTRRRLRPGGDRSAKGHCRASMRAPHGGDRRTGSEARKRFARAACRSSWSTSPAARAGAPRCSSTSPRQPIGPNASPNSIASPSDYTRDQAASRRLLRHRARTNPAPA